MTTKSRDSRREPHQPQSAAARRGEGADAARDDLARKTVTAPRLRLGGVDGVARDDARLLKLARVLSGADALDEDRDRQRAAGRRAAAVAPRRRRWRR